MLMCLCINVDTVLLTRSSCHLSSFPVIHRLMSPLTRSVRHPAPAAVAVVVTVALNYQTAGLMMDLNDGRFLANGACGYVLKPQIMRDEISYFSANTRDVIPGVSPQRLHVKVGCSK